MIKTPNLQMHRKLGKTYTQPAIGVIGVPPGPPGGVPNAKPSIKASSFFAQLKDAYISTFQRPGLTLEKISVSRGEAQSFGKFTPAERPGNSL